MSAGDSPPSRIAVIGAGTMGHGIAQVSAMAGYTTTIYDVKTEMLDRAMDKVRANLDKGVAKGKVSEALRDGALGNLSTNADLGVAIEGAAVVIEAVPEIMKLKKGLAAEIGEACGPDTILASNTSSLSLTEIAASSPHPGRVVGMHFFNPPHILKLLELVRAEQTTDDTLDRARAVGEAMGRKIITVSDSPGFATSRLGVVLGLEAMRMLEQGVGTAQDIDTALELGYGHSMGPLKVTDLVGLDVRLAIAEYLYAELGGDQYRPPQILRRMVRAGKLGKKVGEGFYRWDS